jgi:hypothetical protein
VLGEVRFRAGGLSRWESPDSPVFGSWSIDGPASNWISPQNEVNALGGLYIYKQTFKAPVS